MQFDIRNILIREDHSNGKRAAIRIGEHIHSSTYIILQEQFHHNEHTKNKKKMPPPTLRVSKAATDAQALTNCLIVNKDEFPSSVRYVLINGQFCFTALYVSISIYLQTGNLISTDNCK